MSTQTTSTIPVNGVTVSHIHSTTSLHTDRITDSPGRKLGILTGTIIASGKPSHTIIMLQKRDDPSPSPPPIPTEPSAEYLELSQQPSTHIDDPSSSRKLLILDLNGTLLYREGKPQGPRRYRRDRFNGSSEPQHRVAHPRPYMGSFRQYLFHPKTLEWLDTMVWSSAQPFNVDHMVDQCFKEEKEKLVAVWARDTLGLTSAQYHGPSHSADEPAPTSEPSRSAYSHSALTTLLLDDSPLKAQLQPWNHFCVPEYTAQIRGHDLSTRQQERDKPPSDVQDAEGGASRKKRKKSKKALGYDQILLAVIGVLDTIKGESNVSGWMQQCGLWNGQDRKLEDNSTSESPQPPDNQHVNPSSPSPVADKDKLWFENEAVVSHWAKLGLDALAALGIPAEAGI
ncbi:hypothetical protein EV421DRAFT_1890124 [Armillaria borealis]|uniref:Mitochondrial import inner membrane translocase subunit TIM50 n=1 Tax=Armillaria borealis TaxID=47425 RepID=A0AA39MUI2_9AGAR|nr:hypothetical protein EV421DRAFT_1890124 [Armillaria borealis]